MNPQLIPVGRRILRGHPTSNRTDLKGIVCNIMSGTVTHIHRVVIVDRNPNVRELLRRELSLEGFRILLTGKGKELIERIDQGETVDLLILDPDIPDMDHRVLIETIRHRLPGLPIILHGFILDVRDFGKLPGPITLVEKQADSIDRLKQTITDMMSTQTAAMQEH